MFCSHTAPWEFCNWLKRPTGTRACQIAELERSKTEQATLCGLFSCFHFSELCKQRELERKVRGMKLRTESRGVCEILIDFARNGRQKVCVFEIF